MESSRSLRSRTSGKWHSFHYYRMRAWRERPIWLIYSRSEREPIIYDGDLMDEENVLDFLTSLEAMDLPDRIEEVNGKILSKIIEESDFVAVLFCKYGVWGPIRRRRMGKSWDYQLFSNLSNRSFLILSSTTVQPLDFIFIVYHFLANGHLTISKSVLLECCIFDQPFNQAQPILLVLTRWLVSLIAIVTDQHILNTLHHLLFSDHAIPRVIDASFALEWCILCTLDSFRISICTSSTSIPESQYQKLRWWRVSSVYEPLVYVPLKIDYGQHKPIYCLSVAGGCCRGDDHDGYALL